MNPIPKENYPLSRNDDDEATNHLICTSPISIHAACRKSHDRGRCKEPTTIILPCKVKRQYQLIFALQNHTTCNKTRRETYQFTEQVDRGFHTRDPVSLASTDLFLDLVTHSQCGEDSTDAICRLSTRGTSSPISGRG